MLGKLNDFDGPVVAVAAEDKTGRLQVGD